LVLRSSPTVTKGCRNIAFSCAASHVTCINAYMRFPTYLTVSVLNTKLNYATRKDDFTGFLILSLIFHADT
jgi:hypothetical protein